MHMPLKIYSISSTLTHPDVYASIKDDALHDDIHSFFVMNRNRGDLEERIRKLDMEFIAGKGYTQGNIVKTDHIPTFSALLFSKRFVDSVGGALKDEMQFFPCRVLCRGASLDWFAARITNRFPIVDKELSTYRTLTDGTPILNNAIYRTGVEEQFHIARDTDSISYVGVTDLFKDLCEQNGLSIGFEG